MLVSVRLYLVHLDLPEVFLTDQLFRCLIVSIHVSGNFSFVFSIDVVRVKSCDLQVHQCWVAVNKFNYFEEITINFHQPSCKPFVHVCTVSANKHFFLSFFIYLFI